MPNVFGMPRRLPQYNAGHPGYQSPLGSRTLPQVSGGGQPLTPLGSRYGAGGMMQGGRPIVAPGDGNVFYHDNEYNPTPGFGRQVGAYVAQDRAYGAAAGTGPYDSSGARSRFESLQGRQQRPLQMPAAGTYYGGGTRMVQMPDGRMVGLGPSFVNSTLSGTGPLSTQAQNDLLAGAYSSQRPGSTAFEANRKGAMNAAGGNQVMVQTGGPIGGLTADQEARRQDVILRQRDQKAGLAEGRRNRAIGKYGLNHLQPTQNYTFDTGIGRNGGYARTGPLASTNGAIGGVPTTPLAQRQQEHQKTWDAPVIGDLVANAGFDVETAGLPEIQNAFLERSGNWSESDRADFRRYLQTRASADEEFRKQFNAWAGQSEYDAYSDGSPMDGTTSQINSQNELRKMLGLPPLKPRRAGTEDDYPIGGYPMT